MRKGLALCLLLAAGCAATDVGYGAPSVTQALIDGYRAERSGDADALALAADRLYVAGAQPADGAGDLAAEWRARAAELGAEPSTAPPTRGRALGPAYRRGTLAAGAADSIGQTFLAGQRAEVSLVSADGVALQIEVKDEEGGRVCSAASSGREATCRWLPKWTARYEIDVRNSGRASGRYVLVVN